MAEIKKTLSQAIAGRRATPSFDGVPIPLEDLKQILDAGLHAPSGYNMQPWRFIVVQAPEQKKKLRAASYNQAKVEEASAVIVACGDADGWRKDLDLMIQLGREGGMPESYAAQAQTSVSNFLSGFSREQMHGWLNKHVMIALTHMMLMAEVMGYDTAPMEGFEQDKVHEVLRLPMSYWVVALLAVGHLKGPDKFYGGRFEMAHTVFGEEFGKPLK
ncbi:nitroreductase family protein [Edaphobacter sp. 12200R-103]|jgi:nitroreductase|uniref:nitroreductase family protein n=1 Tax=Edaphobacter sp. 12200R-103 TaxID=2703788 RepID=UPI00138D69F0|nr:nitroreductase family protein [Edaphobacter sp. 12200R-103]QHS51665.1 nitroreductase family protein [Edaphobacter sp. 12200R-103]